MGMDPQYTLDDALQHAARSLAQGTGGAGAAAGQSAPTTAAATQGQANAQGGSTPVRPLRAMLARGAACDTCRARKVKCDASRPFCTPCLKSSRGDSALALTKCKYEGTSVAAAREAAAAAREAGGGVGGGRKKRKVEGEEGERGGKRKGTKGAVEGQGWQGGVVDASTFASAFDPRVSGHAGGYSTTLPPPPGYPTALPPPPPPANSSTTTLAEAFRPLPPPLAPTATSTSTSSTTLPPALAYDSKASPAESVKKEVVEGLEGRIAELERQLRAREAAANGNGNAGGNGGYYAAALHTRSPSFPYAFPAQSSAAYAYPGATYPSSLPPPLSASSAPAQGIPLPSPSSTYPTQPLTPSAHPHAYPPIQLAPPGGSSPRTGRSLSALSAAAAGIEDFPGWSAQESNLRSSVPPPSGVAGGWTAAAQSPMSSLRYSALPASEGGEGFVLSPRGSLGRERERGTPVFAVVGASKAATSEEKTSVGAGGGGSTRPGSSSSATSPHSSATTSSSSPPKADTTTFSALDDFSLSPELYALLHPSYPPSLPPIATVHHLVQTFFLRAKIPAQMLNHRNILESMLYGPADPRWPDEALLHAMCAFAAQYVSEESLGNLGPYASGLGLEMDGAEEEEKKRKSRYWERDGTRTARAYHYMHAKRSIHEAVDSDLNGAGKARDMLQVLQACIITCYVAYQSASFTDLWLFGGLATRLCTPLGLNHLEPWDFFHNRCGPSGEDWSRRIRFAPRAELLGLPQTLEEHAERATTFWMAFAVDRFASASTDWSTSIDEKDITTPLPCRPLVPHPSLLFDKKTLEIPALSISSSNFFEDATAPIGSLGLYIKATVLLGRVVNFLQRNVPRAKCVEQGESCSGVKAEFKSREEFVELDVALSKFKANHSANFYDAADNAIDGFLASAYAIPHVATMLLHETFTDRYDMSPTSSINRCLSSAKCVVNAMHILYQSNYDLGGCDPFLPFCWSVTARALVRDYTTRRFWGQHEAAQASLQLAEQCLSFHDACAKMGSPIAQCLATTLRKHLDNPDILLPVDGTEL
ncbi:hypothetical protein JCM10021v2_003637 [Rhodotorula toruloides]